MRPVSRDVKIVFENVDAGRLITVPGKAFHHLPPGSVQRDTLDQLRLGIGPVEPAVGTIDRQIRRPQQVFRGENRSVFAGQFRAFDLRPAALVDPVQTASFRVHHHRLGPFQITRDDRPIHPRVDGIGANGFGPGLRPIDDATDPIYGDTARVVETVDERVGLTVSVRIAVIAAPSAIGGVSILDGSKVGRRRNRRVRDASVVMIRPKEEGPFGVGHVYVDGGYARRDFPRSVEDVVVAVAYFGPWVEEAQLIFVRDEQIRRISLSFAGYIVRRGGIVLFEQLGFVEFRRAETIVAADLVDASLGAFAEELTLVDVDAGGFSLVRQAKAVGAFAVVGRCRFFLIHLDALVLASVIGTIAAVTFGFVRMVRAIGKRVAKAIARNAFAPLVPAFPLVGGTIARGEGADLFVGSVVAVGVAVADARPGNTRVRAAALETAQRTAQISAHEGVFVAAVAAVVFTVATPRLGNAERVVAKMFVGRTRSLTLEFVRTVGAICVCGRKGRESGRGGGRVGGWGKEK